MTIKRAAILALACGIIWPATFAARRLAHGYTCTDDLNGDSRPDRWRVYDASGRLIRVAVDTNFDGRADVEDYYQNGRLVRRDIDRNFDGRVDDREEFDPATGEPIRSVVDVDFDGTADELLLFDHGTAVVRDWVSNARPGPPNPRAAAFPPESSALTAFRDPFAGERTVRPRTRGDEHLRLVSGSKLLAVVRPSHLIGRSSCRINLSSTTCPYRRPSPSASRAPPTRQPA